MDSADRVDHLPTGNQIESVFATIQVCRHSPILKGQRLTYRVTICYTPRDRPRLIVEPLDMFHSDVLTAVKRSDDKGQKAGQRTLRIP